MGPEDTASVGIERVPFEFGDPHEATRIVRGRVVRPAREQFPGPLPWVLVLHGFKGFMDWGFFPSLCERLAQRGVAAVTFNASGSGVGPDLQSFSDLESFRRDTLSRQLEDIDRVRSRALSGELGRLCGERRGLFGHSRGGALALVHAAEEGGYQAVATWAALDDFDRWDEPTKDLWRRTGVLPILNARTGQELPMGVGALTDFEQNATRFDVRASVASLGSSLFMLHGDADEVVSVDSSRSLFALAPAPAHLGILEGQGHTLGCVHPMGDAPRELNEALGLTAGWLSETLAP